MLIAHLGSGDSAGLETLRAEFARRNPGYAIDLAPEAARLEPAEIDRVAFVHGGEAAGELAGAESRLGIGDVVLVRAGQSLSADAPLDLVVFTVPDPIPADLPTFLRPDQDPAITDTPGGCATDGDAYRRVVLTWLDANGPYSFRALNAHRVRMTDSFSHYHPVDGGFDELYLVQGVEPGARLITSDRVERIESPDRIEARELGGLLRVTTPRTGDLVYIGRGEMHRAVGGVLAHVITVPGFVPGSEIGVDHHLHAINTRLGLEGERALPLHAAAADRAVIK